MNWDDYRFILAIARNGSLSGAAEKLGVDQTTVSRRLNAAENELGAPLFIRNRSDYRLTEAGEAAIAHIETIETATMRLAEAVGAGLQSPSGIVRIATMPWIFNCLIVPGLPAFSQRYPNINIHAISGLRERSLSLREAELSLRFEMEPRGQEKSIDIANIPYALYATKDQDPRVLPWVGFTADAGSYAPGRWLEKSMAVSPQPVAFQANDAGILFRAVCAGAGKGLLPERLAENEPDLVRLSGKNPEIVRTLKVLVHPDVEDIERIVVVIDWLRSELSRAPVG